MRVKPRSRKNAILGAHAGALRLGVTAAPEKGKANRAVLELLAETLDVPLSCLEITAGLASKDKTVVVRLSIRTVGERLARFVV